jgi:quercetin dioxygenase-like cupin family protein
MSFKPYWIVVLVLIPFRTVLAQDPTKVESSHYKLAFENESVQVVDVHYGPHEKSGMHDHPDGVVVVIHGGHLKFTDQDGKVREVFSKVGESRWFPPFKHKVENLGDTPYDAVYIGMKTKRMTSRANSPNRSVPIDAQTARVLAGTVLVSNRGKSDLR